MTELNMWILLCSDWSKLTLWGKVDYKLPFTSSQSFVHSVAQICFCASYILGPILVTGDLVVSKSRETWFTWNLETTGTDIIQTEEGLTKTGQGKGMRGRESQAEGTAWAKGLW